jgi:ComF family protein
MLKNTCFTNFSHTLVRCLDLLAPRHNRNFTTSFGYLTDKEIENQDSFFKFHESADIECFFISSCYDDESIQDLIHRAKFYLEKAIAYDLARLIHTKTQLYPQLLPKPDLIIPIPHDKERFAQRGFHIPYILSTKLSTLTDFPQLQLLEKTRTTESQVSLDKTERERNLHNVFTIKPNINESLVNCSTIWLVDDLCTTGATFLEAARAMKAEYPFLKVYAIAASGNR